MSAQEAAGVIFDEAVDTTSVEVGMPQGRTVAVACDGDVSVAWWIDSKGAYDEANAEVIEAPGGVIERCPAARAKFATEAAVCVRIVRCKD